MKLVIALCLAAFGPNVLASSLPSCGPHFGPESDRIGTVLRDGLYRGFVNLPAGDGAVAGEVELRVAARRAFVTVATPRGPVSTMVDLEHTVVIRELNKYLMYGTTLHGTTVGVVLLFGEDAAIDVENAFAQFAAVPASVSRL